MCRWTSPRVNTCSTTWPIPSRFSFMSPTATRRATSCRGPSCAMGHPVENREAVALRDALIERLAALAPVPGALDQIVQHFGTDQVAEITGRSRRIVRKRGPGRADRLAVENRAGSANLAEAQAFMDDAKRILVFSDAGGTGRSYHAELSAKNQRLRVHYLLEAGWKADAAIQGLGPHQSHQSGTAPAVQAGCDECEGGKTLSLHHRAPPRHARRDHQRPAARPAGRAYFARRIISKATTHAMRCGSFMSCWSAAKSTAVRWKLLSPRQG